MSFFTPWAQNMFGPALGRRNKGGEIMAKLDEGSDGAVLRMHRL